MNFKMHLQEKPFYMIKSGQKDIEMRLYDDKRKQIKVGDTIEFSNTETGQAVNTKVTNISVYENFEQIYDKYDKTRLGYLENEEARAEDMNKYYSQEEVKKYGVVGIEVKI